MPNSGDGLYSGFCNVGYSLERIPSNPTFFPIIDGAPFILHVHLITLFQSRLFSMKNLLTSLKISSPLL